MGALTPALRAALDDQAEGLLYPRDRLDGLTTALMGFCAAFLGRQDCVWVADAGLTATGVDVDQERLDQMVDIYPDDWTFVCADVFEYAQQCRVQGLTCDLVSLDPPSNLFDVVADTAGLWCQIARKVVLLATGPATRVTAPEGWEQTGRIRRSNYLGGVYWTILEPAA